MTSSRQVLDGTANSNKHLFRLLTHSKKRAPLTQILGQKKLSKGAGQSRPQEKSGGVILVTQRHARSGRRALRPRGRRSNGKLYGFRRKKTKTTAQRLCVCAAYLHAATNTLNEDSSYLPRLRGMEGKKSVKRKVAPRPSKRAFPDGLCSGKKKLARACGQLERTVPPTNCVNEVILGVARGFRVYESACWCGRAPRARRKRPSEKKKG